MFTNQKIRMVLQAERRADRKPYKRSSVDYISMLTCHKKSQFECELENKLFCNFVCKITAPKHCSLKRLDELKPISLNEMYVNKVHAGFYLMCHVIGEPYISGNTLSIVVGDQTGDVEYVIVYDYMKSFEVDPNDLLPLYSTIVIKEPFLNENESNFGVSILVVSPSDIVSIDHFVNILPLTDASLSYKQFNDAGNKCYVSSEYWKAIRLYTKALKVSYIYNYIIKPNIFILS